MIDKKLKHAKDYIRLNAKNLTDIHPLLVEVITEDVLFSEYITKRC